MRSRSHNTSAQTLSTQSSAIKNLFSSQEEKSGQLSPMSKSDAGNKNPITSESPCPISIAGTSCPGELVNSLLSNMGWGVMLYKNHRYCNVILQLII